MRRDAKADLALCNAATPGPWGWRANAKTKEIWLYAVHGLKNIVMDFARWGTHDAQPRFNNDGIMDDAKDLLKYRRPYDDSDLDVDHADARFIAESREALPHWIERAQKAEKFAQNHVAEFEAACRACREQTGGCEKPEHCPWYKLAKEARRCLEPST